MTICWDCLGGKPVVTTLTGASAGQTLLQTTCDVCKLRKSSYLKVPSITKEEKRNMTIEEVVGLMRTSKNEMEWDDNCDKVKAAHGGHYPSFWFGAVMSVVYRSVSLQWQSES